MNTILDKYAHFLFYVQENIINPKLVDIQRIKKIYIEFYYQSKYK